MSASASATEFPFPKIERVIRRDEMAELIGVSIPTLWRMTKSGELPPPIRIGKQLAGWPQSDYDSWLADRKAERAQANGSAA